MGSKDQHLELYNKNKKLANSTLISKDENRDWKITMIYYSILHLLDSKYADFSIHPNDHIERKEVIQNCISKNIYYTYKTLENLSRQSRYDCIKMKSDDVLKAQQLASLIEETLKK